MKFYEQVFFLAEYHPVLSINLGHLYYYAARVMHDYNIDYINIIQYLFSGCINTRKQTIKSVFVVLWLKEKNALV